MDTRKEGQAGEPVHVVAGRGEADLYFHSACVLSHAPILLDAVAEGVQSPFHGRLVRCCTVGTCLVLS